MDEIKLGLIAMNMLCPGFTSLINILITSIPEASINSFQRAYSPERGGMWVKEYVDGASMEIYRVTTFLK